MNVGVLIEEKGEQRDETEAADGLVGGTFALLFKVSKQNFHDFSCEHLSPLLLTITTSNIDVEIRNFQSLFRF